MMVKREKREVENFSIYINYESKNIDKMKLTVFCKEVFLGTYSLFLGTCSFKKDNNHI